MAKLSARSKKLGDIKILLSRPSRQLEPLSFLGRVCTELPSAIHHRTHTLPVRTWLPTTLVRWALRCSRCLSLALREREGQGLSPQSSPKGNYETQEPGQRKKILDPTLLQDFHSANPSRPIPRGRGLVLLLSWQYPTTGMYPQQVGKSTNKSIQGIYKQISKGNPQTVIHWNKQTKSG